MASFYRLDPLYSRYWTSGILEIYSSFSLILHLHKTPAQQHGRDCSLKVAWRGVRWRRYEGLCHRADSYCNSCVRSGPTAGEEANRTVYTQSVKQPADRCGWRCNRPGVWKSNMSQRLRFEGVIYLIWRVWPHDVENKDKKNKTENVGATRIQHS